jgi:hypothetical protein
VKTFGLLFCLLALTGTSCGEMAEPEIHLIPAGYMGNVYIFHNVADGEPLRREGRARVYEIPKDGILRSQSPENPGWGSPQYFYVTPDGKREKIVGDWPTTIHDTPENRADRTLGIYFPRTGSLMGLQVNADGSSSTSDSKCAVHFEEYYVGTKLFLLTSSNLEKDLNAYVKEHPICK